MPKRFFVTVETRSDRAWEELGDTDLDLFHATGNRRQRGGTIEGLLSIKEVASLVEEGYRVTVVDPEARRSRARDTIDFEDWLETI